MNGAQRSLLGYQPTHTSLGSSEHKPKSRWPKGDRRTLEALERAYHLAEAKYNLHRAEHDKGSGSLRDFNIVMRGGRLKP